MGRKIGLLLRDCFLNRDLINDIFLGSVLDTNVAQSERHFLITDHSLGVSSPVHDVDLGDDTDGADTLWV